MTGVKREWRLLGINPPIICAALTAAIMMIGLFAGDLLNFSPLCFEVIYPIFAAVAVGEWGKTRADENYELVASQAKSLLPWAAARFFAGFLWVLLSAAASMGALVWLRREMPVWEMAVTCFAPAFFLASLAALLNLCISQEHAVTLICGAVGIVQLLLQSLLRVSWVPYVYLFVRFSGNFPKALWLANKGILTVFGLVFWAIAALLCRRKQQKI